MPLWDTMGDLPWVPRLDSEGVYCGLSEPFELMISSMVILPLLVSNGVIGLKTR